MGDALTQKRRHENHDMFISFNLLRKFDKITLPTRYREMDFSNHEVEQKCNYLTKLFNISNEDLFVHWEAFKYQEKKDPNSKISLDLLEELQKYIQTTIVSKLKQNEFKQPPVKKRKVGVHPSNDDPDKLFDQGEVKLIETFNAHIESKPTTIKNKSFKIIGDFTPSKYNYKTMNLKLLEIADYIDDRINTFTNLICKHNSLSLDQISNPNIQSQSEIYTVGRVVPDSPTTIPSELNIDSLYLETSRATGFGYRIPLDLSAIKQHSFFSGQIVGFKGINLSGQAFKVLEVLKFPYLGSASFTETEVNDFMDVIGDDNLKIAVLAGPYHPKNSLDFSKLEKIVKHLNNSVEPDLVVLSGPFIDTSNVANILPTLVNNEKDDISDLKSIDDLYQAYILPIISDLKCPKKIIIPHPHDSHAHSTYPQARFDRKALGLDKSFKSFPNPSIFLINELSIGISTPDILRDLKDITTPASNPNRIERIINHLIQQRSFYPLQNSPNAQIDTSFMGLAELEQTLPDIMILPSILKQFVKCVKNMMVINPGAVANGAFALLQVKSPDLQDMDSIVLEDDEEVSKDWIATIWKRGRVDMFCV